MQLICRIFTVWGWLSSWKHPSPRSYWKDFFAWQCFYKQTRLRGGCGCVWKEGGRETAGSRPAGIPLLQHPSPGPGRGRNPSATREMWDVDSCILKWMQRQGNTPPSLPWRKTSCSYAEAWRKKPRMLHLPGEGSWMQSCSEGHKN